MDNGGVFALHLLMLLIYGLQGRRTHLLIKFRLMKLVYILKQDLLMNLQKKNQFILSWFHLLILNIQYLNCLRKK